jgi:hypothetical protein
VGGERGEKGIIGDIGDIGDIGEIGEIGYIRDGIWDIRYDSMTESVNCLEIYVYVPVYALYSVYVAVIPL